VGGSSKLLRLRQELSSRWPFPNILTPPEAEWDIARGAALLAANPGCYRIAESIGVILSDDSYHPLFPSGTSVQDAHFHIPFGLVEDTKTATFVFASKSSQGQEPKQIGEMHVKTLGFRDELIELESRITEDLETISKQR
jgi:molecular chaperone DnaK